MRCTICSKACEVQVKRDEFGVKIVTGCLCQRGVQAFMMDETDADELYKYYLPVKNGYMKHVLIISDGPFEKKWYASIDQLLSKMVIEAPIQKNDVILDCPLGLPIKIMAARSLKQRR
jgi:CxxC motif-containing protein